MAKLIAAKGIYNDEGVIQNQFQSGSSFTVGDTTTTYLEVDGSEAVVKLTDLTPQVSGITFNLTATDYVAFYDKDGLNNVVTINSSGNITAAGTMTIDTINEYTSDTGVTVEGVRFENNEAYMDTINEKTGGAGVTIDSVVLKDGLVEGVSIVHTWPGVDLGLDVGGNGQVTIDYDGSSIDGYFKAETTVGDHAGPMGIYSLPGINSGFTIKGLATISQPFITLVKQEVSFTSDKDSAGTVTKEFKHSYDGSNHVLDIIGSDKNGAYTVEFKSPSNLTFDQDLSSTSTSAEFTTLSTTNFSTTNLTASALTASGVTTDLISEMTAANGVVIDGVTCKDNTVTATNFIGEVNGVSISEGTDNFNITGGTSAVMNFTVDGNGADRSGILNFSGSDFTWNMQGSAGWSNTDAHYFTSLANGMQIQGGYTNSSALRWESDSAGQIVLTHTDATNKLNITIGSDVNVDFIGTMDFTSSETGGSIVLGNSTPKTFTFTDTVSISAATNITGATTISETFNVTAACDIDQNLSQASEVTFGKVTTDEINAPAASNITATLSDTAGASSYVIKDSSGVSIFDYDSDGRAQFINPASSTTVVDINPDTGMGVGMNITMSNGGTITGLPLTPTADSEAASKAYVETFAQGMHWKNACETATSGALTAPDWAAAGAGVGKTLTGPIGFDNTLQGYTLTVGDRVLIKDGGPNVTDADIDNGIYTVTQLANGVDEAIIFTRATDCDGSPEGEVEAGVATMVAEGDLQGRGYLITTTGTISVDTTPISWTQFAGPGSYYAGAGLNLFKGDTFEIVTAAGTGIDYNIAENAIEILLDPTPDLASNEAGALYITNDGLGVAVDNDSISASGNQLIAKLATNGGLRKNLNGGGLTTYWKNNKQQQCGTTICADAITLDIAYGTTFDNVPVFKYNIRYDNATAPDNIITSNSYDVGTSSASIAFSAKPGTDYYIDWEAIDPNFGDGVV